MARIYNLTKGLNLADATIVPLTSQNAARFVAVKTDQVLFPVAANDIDAAIALEGTLTGIQEKAISDGGVYALPLTQLSEFGIQKGAEGVVKVIMQRFAETCLQKHSEGSKFTPGTQFNFYGVTKEGIEVTLGNYGLFFATTIAASLDSELKRYLVEEGERLLGRRQGFFVNLPGTSLTIETSDGKALFTNRGPTAEWKGMYGLAAAGHHNPKTTLAEAREITYKGATAKAIPLSQLAAHQLETELAATPEETGKVIPIAVIYSTGYEIEGTEKPELVAHAELSFTAEEAAKRIKEKAQHRWETRVLYAATQEQLNKVIKGTLDKRKQPASLDEMVILGEKGITPGTDANSFSYWVPVHAAALLTQV